MPGVSTVPFFPHPLEAEVAHVYCEPFREASSSFDVEPVRQRGIKFANRLANSRSDSRW